MPMVTGTVWEPNLFGSYSLTVGCIAAGLAFAPQLSSRAWQWRLQFATVLGFAGVIVSMVFSIVLLPSLLRLAYERSVPVAEPATDVGLKPDLHEARL